LDGWAELDEQGVSVALVVWLPPVALALDFDEAVVLSPPVAVEVALALPVAVVLGVAVSVSVAVALLPGLLLVLPLGGLLTEFPGGAVGDADLADPAWVDDGGHAVACTLLGAAEVAPPLASPGAEPTGVPSPFAVGAAPPVLELENPTAVPSWTKAWRSGGSASATPMANTAQAAASAGRSHPYRQSRCCRSPSPAASCPPRAAFQRRIMPARKPALAAQCLLVWADPELTRARIRSSPSDRGSS